MAFSEKTADLINQLVSAEYHNACEHFGDKYNSLHEGYAVLLEEIEEVEFEIKHILSCKNDIWGFIKAEILEDYDLKAIKEYIYHAIAELAQCAAVVEKMRNTKKGGEYD